MTASPLQPAFATVRRAGLADADALLELHRSGFGSNWRMQHWRWRFVDNPLGALCIVGAFAPSGRCLASFAGVPLPCLYRGQPALVLRAGDAAVLPELRATLASGLLVKRAGKAFFDMFGDSITRVAFGFPGPGLTRSLVRHCRFEVLADVLWLVRDVAGTRAADPDLVATVAATLPADVDELARLWHRDVNSAIVRDARYLTWRYQDNPHARFAFATARSSTGRLRGLAVLRPDGLDPQSLAVVEWIVPIDDQVAETALLAAAADVARRAGRATLAFTFAPSSPQFTCFQVAHRFRVMRSPFRLAFRSYAAGLDQPFLAENWQYSLGDMDFT